VKRIFEAYILLSRWLLAPFLVMMTLAQFALIYKAGKKAVGIFTLLAGDQEDHVALAVLNLVDVTLISALLVIVTISVYENFVSRVSTKDHGDWPRWMGDIDFWQLKMKLLTTTVAISAIKLLESFVDIPEISDRDLMFYIGMHLTFVVSTVALAIAQRLSHQNPRGPDADGEH
jgi:uncharacterized protein (TIGR00645 family)